MSTKYPGGIISKTAPTPSGPYSNDTAPGIWTLEQQAYWQKLGQWPTAGNNPVDPQFNYVTMLLHGDGTNGAQNNTFLDSSTNNFTITRNGNTTQGSFSPYGSNWSNYFDGTGDYLTAANNTALDVGTGAFTIEGWIYRDGTGDADWRLVAGSVSSAGFFGGRGTLSLGFGRSAVAWDLESASNVYSLNTWTHVVYVRNGSGNLAIFANGTRVATTTNSNNYGLNGGLLEVGAEGAGQYIGGYISNVRVVKGSAVYDPTSSTLTVPTTPLTAVSGTGLLTCQSNRFIDNSTNNFTLTVNGNTSVQRFNPFGASTAYSTSVIGGSGYFDGSGDYLTTSGTGSFNPRSTFTVEFWTYPITNTTVDWINSNTNDYFYIETYLGTLYVGDGSANTISTTPPALNCWTHVLLSFDGTTYRLFYNGVSQATSTTLLASNTITAFRIGQKNDTSRPFNGYINDLRVLVGTALYTSTFTPPTAPLTAISNTTLLLNYTNGAIFDNAMINDLETLGNSQISTSVVKYGTGSLAFDGTGDYLLSSNTGNFGTGDFTVEYWDNHGTQSNTNYAAQVGNLSTATPSGTWRFGTFSNTGGLYFAYHTGSAYVDVQFGTTLYNDSTWRHFALTRSGTTVRAFVNGVQVGTDQTISQNFNSTNKIILGVEFVTSGYFTGYLDDVRITTGYARYTANFTPPTAAFFNYGPT